MAASATDKARKSYSYLQKTLSSSISDVDVALTPNNVNNIPTDTGVSFVVDRVDSSGNKTPSLRELMTGVISGSTIASLVRGQQGTTAQAHASGAVIEFVNSGQMWNDLIDFLLQDHSNPAGHHKTLTDDNGNTWFERGQTASAVNNLKATNAATGASPQLGASGTDTDIGITRVMKGKGNDIVKGRADGWNDLSGFGTFTYAANAGQKEFTVTTPSDLSSFLSVGQRIRFDRGTTPPTQAGAFTAASSQYATKASPSGVTFTGVFTCEAWVYLNSYTGNESFILNRRNSTFNSGWAFGLDANGCVKLLYGSGANATDFVSYQSIPLKRWVHIAAVCTSVASKTAVIYINGIAVPTFNNVTAATTLAQATEDLRVGAVAGGTLTNTYFDGYLSEVRLWSTNQSAANVLANMTTSLTGSESSLIGLWQFNGVFTDKTSNANTLTANGGAIATQATNPYNSTEYGLITKVSSTTLTIFTGTDYMIPNMTLNNPYYSTARAPAGFPAGRDKWVVDVIMGARRSNAGSAAGTWTNVGWQIGVPTGEWEVGYECSASATASAGTAFFGVALTMSTANNTNTNPEFWSQSADVSSSVAEIDASLYKHDFMNMTALTTFFLNCTSSGGTSNGLFVGNQNVNPTVGRAYIRAVCAYL